MFYRYKQSKLSLKRFETAQSLWLKHLLLQRNKQLLYEKCIYNRKIDDIQNMLNKTCYFRWWNWCRIPKLCDFWWNTISMCKSYSIPELYWLKLLDWTRCIYFKIILMFWSTSENKENFGKCYHLFQSDYNNKNYTCLFQVFNTNWLLYCKWNFCLK